MTTTSLRFSGLPVASPTERSSDSYAFLLRPDACSIADRVRVWDLASRSFSLDVWFGLNATVPNGMHSGGVLFGLQSTHAESRQWPKYHQQLVLVSADGDLYASVIDFRPVVARKLKAERWYHLALTYDVASKQQQVFLDGLNLRTDTGELHHEWKFLQHEQVGTGCITAVGLQFPTPGYLGWYGFNGIVDEFRVWEGVLSQGEVDGLQLGDKMPERTLIATLKVKGGAPRGSRWNVTEVQCSRPSGSRRLKVVDEGASHGVVRPEQLPADTVKTLCSFLTGFDAFNLSHTNFWWMRYLSDGSLWQRCFSGSAVNNEELEGDAWKQHYMLSRSMLFRGLQTDDNRRADSYAYFNYAGREQRRQAHFHLTYLGSESFSFDVWFSLSPATDGKCVGGVLYGLQSASRESRQWPYYHQQLVVVSSDGNLHCSVLDSRPVVASKLERNRWYHLALTYDNSLQRQDVYLDGVKLRSDIGTLHQEWGFLSHEQVGTGCITAGNLNFPRPNHLGWYGFHGLIDEFRIWGEALSQEEITVLARGGSLSYEKLRASVKQNVSGTPLRSPLVSWVNVQLAMCTRPTEGEILQLAKDPSSSQPDCIIS